MKQAEPLVLVPGLMCDHEPGGRPIACPVYSFLKRMDRAVGPLPAINGEID